MTAREENPAAEGIHRQLQAKHFWILLIHFFCRASSLFDPSFNPLEGALQSF